MCILKLIKNNIFQINTSIELKFCMVSFLSLESTVEKNKIVTINMEILKFRKTQS